MFVLTVDQRASRRRGDEVPALLTQLAEWEAQHAGETFVLPMTRTVGDEVQGVVATAAATVACALHLQRLEQWSVGIGAGQISHLGPSAPESSGGAFVHARSAVERARSRLVSVPLAVEGPEKLAAADAEALLQLLAALVRRRRAAGWEVIDLLEETSTQREVAARLDISAQAVSQRLSATLWHEEQALHDLAARLLVAAGGGEGLT